MTVSNQKMVVKKFADRLTPGSRVALLKSAADIIRSGVIAALGDGFIVVRCEDGGIYKIYRSLILLSRDCPQIKMIRFEVLKND